MSNVKQLLIVNTDGDATNKTAVTFADVRAGKLGLIADGAVVAGLSATAENQFAVGTFTSSPFLEAEVVRAIKVPSSAGTAQVATFDFASPEAGDPLYVKLINTTIGTMDVEINSYEDTTAQKIVDAINADGAKEYSKFAGFTASLAGTVITVTAPINSTFRGAATDGVVIAYTVNAAPSVGTDADMIELETEALTSRGITNNVGFPVVKPASDVVAGATYTQYIYEIARAVPNKAGTGTATAEKNLIIVAVNEAAVNTIAAIDGDAVAEQA